jgi:geranylgeranyl transferase type-2 subunit alpha
MQNAKLLELNPEFYTAWNFQKRAVQHLLLSETDEEAHKRIVKEELDLVSFISIALYTFCTKSQRD